MAFHELLMTKSLYTIDNVILCWELPNWIDIYLSVLSLSHIFHCMTCNPNVNVYSVYTYIWTVRLYICLQRFNTSLNFCNAIHYHFLQAIALGLIIESAYTLVGLRYMKTSLDNLAWQAMMTMLLMEHDMAQNISENSKSGLAIDMEQHVMLQAFQGTLFNNIDLVSCKMRWFFALIWKD